jgi:hypothetical protein
MGLVSMRPFQLPSGLFFIVGGHGSPVKFATSLDATTWDATQQDAKTTVSATDPLTTILSVRYGNGFFLAAGYNASTPVILKSYDGLIWDQVYATADIDFTYVNMIFAHGKYLLAGSKSVLVSTDGEDWTFGQIGVTNPFLDNANNQLAGIQAITSNDAGFVIFDSANGAFSSTDGISWTYTHAYLASGTSTIMVHYPWADNILKAEVNGGNLSLAIANGTSLTFSYFLSFNGSGTSTVTSVDAVDIINGKVYIAFTEDGIHKVIASTDTDGFVFDWLSHDASALGLDIGKTTNYILGTNGDAVLYSQDGTTWYTFGVPFSFTYPINALVIGTTGVTTQDGSILSDSTWVHTNNMPFAGSIIRLPDDTYYGIQDTYTLGFNQKFYSPDGVSWQYRSYNVPTEYTAAGLFGWTLVYNAATSTYFCTSQDPANIDASILTSTDGVNWTLSYNNTISYDTNSWYIALSKLILGPQDNTGNWILGTPDATGDSFLQAPAFVISGDNGTTWNTFTMNFDYVPAGSSIIQSTIFDPSRSKWYTPTYTDGLLVIDTTGVINVIPYPVSGNPVSPGNLVSIGYLTCHPTNGRFVAWGTSYNSIIGLELNALMYSDDEGVTWTVTTMGYTWNDGINTYAGQSFLPYVYGLKYDGGMFIAPIETGMAYSYDGILWAEIPNLVNAGGAYDVLVRYANSTAFPTPPALTIL